MQPTNSIKIKYKINRTLKPKPTASMNNHSKPTTESTYQNTLLSLKETVTHNWEQMCDKSQNDKSRAGLIAKDFIQLVETHFREQHSPVFYAAILNISKSYLRKTCIQAFGHSPKNCVYARVMLESCILFEDPRLNIAEIGSGLGFDDPAYFSRIFKKQRGIPPDAYRKMALKLD